VIIIIQKGAVLAACRVVMPSVDKAVGPPAGQPRGPPARSGRPVSGGLRPSRKSAGNAHTKMTMPNATYAVRQPERWMICAVTGESTICPTPMPIRAVPSANALFSRNHLETMALTGA
jgi:hypothetical protein